MEFLPMEYDGQNGPGGARRQQVLMPVHSITGASYAIGAGSSSSIPGPSYAIAAAPAYAIASPPYCQPYRFAAPSYAIPNGSYITGASYAVTGPSCQVSPPMSQAIPGPSTSYPGMGSPTIAPFIPGTFAMGSQPGISGPYAETGGSYATIGDHSNPYSTIGDHSNPYSTIAYSQAVSSLSYHSASSSTVSGSYPAAAVSLSQSRHPYSGAYPACASMSVPYPTPIASSIPNSYNLAAPRAIQRFYAPTEGQPGIMAQHYSTASHSPIIMSQSYQGPLVVPPMLSPVTTVNGSYIAYANPMEAHSIPNIGNQTLTMCNATEGNPDSISEAMPPPPLAEFTAVNSQKTRFGIKHESSLPSASKAILDPNTTNNGPQAPIPGPSPQLNTSPQIPLQGTSSTISKGTSSLVQIHSSSVVPRPTNGRVVIGQTIPVPVVFQYIPAPEHFLLPENQCRPFQVESGIDIGNLFKLLNALQNRIGFAISHHRFLSDPSTYPEPYDDGGYKPLTVQAATRDLRSLGRQQRSLMEKLRRWNCLRNGACYDLIIKRIYIDICTNCQTFVDFKKRNKSVNRALRFNRKHFKRLGRLLPCTTKGASAPLHPVHPHCTNNPLARTRKKMEHETAKAAAHPESLMTQESFLAELGLVTPEVYAKRKAESVRTERRRRTTANPKYKSKVEETVQTGRCTRSRRSDPESLKTPEPSSSHVARQTVAAKPNCCRVCDKAAGVKTVCRQCLSKYHGKCIRVSGSKALAPPVVSCCPNCVPSHPHVSASDCILASRRISRPSILRVSSARCGRKVGKRRNANASRRRRNAKKASIRKKSPIRRKPAPRKKETSENVNPEEEVKMMTRSRTLPLKQTLNHSLAVAAAAAVPSLFKPSQDISNEQPLPVDTVPSCPMEEKTVAEVEIKRNSKQPKKTSILPKKKCSTSSSVKSQVEPLAKQRGAKVSSLNVELPPKQDAATPSPVDLNITQKRADNHQSSITKKKKKKAKGKGSKHAKRVRDLEQVKIGKADRKERERKEDALLSGPLDQLYMKRTMKAMSAAAGIVMSTAKAYMEQEANISLSIRQVLEEAEQKKKADAAAAASEAENPVVETYETMNPPSPDIWPADNSVDEPLLWHSTTFQGGTPKTKTTSNCKPKTKSIDPWSNAIGKTLCPDNDQKLSQAKRTLPAEPVLMLNGNSKPLTQRSDSKVSPPTNSPPQQACSSTQIQKPLEKAKTTIRKVTAKVIIPDVPPPKEGSDSPLVIARKSLPTLTDNKIVVPIPARKQTFRSAGAPPIKPRRITSLGRKSSISGIIHRSASQITIQRVIHPTLTLRTPAPAVPQTPQATQDRTHSEPEPSTSKGLSTQSLAKSSSGNSSNARKSFRKKTFCTPESIDDTISRVIAASNSDADTQRLNGSDEESDDSDTSEHSIQYPSTSRGLQSVDKFKYSSDTQDPPESTGHFSGGYSGSNFPQRRDRSPSPSSSESSLGSSRSVNADDSSSDDLLSIPGTTPYFVMPPRVKPPPYLDLEALNRLDLQDFKGAEYLPPAPQPGPSNKKGPGPGGKGKGKKK